LLGSVAGVVVLVVAVVPAVLVLGVLALEGLLLVRLDRQSV
jgi:hypothetical protein